MTTSLGKVRNSSEDLTRLNDSHSIDTGLDGHSRIIHVAANVGKDLETS